MNLRRHENIEMIVRNARVYSIEDISRLGVEHDASEGEILL